MANCLCARERVILMFIVRHKSTYIILFLTRHTESMNDAKTRIFTHHPRVSLARFTFCWWRHNRLAMTPQWPDNCVASTWQVISNLLDIDFIHGDIHGRSCKNSTLWSRVSSAINKSKDIENGIFLASISWQILSVNSRVANSVDWSLRNPYWNSWSRPWDKRITHIIG